MMEPSLARSLWLTLEPIHAVVYFEPSARDTYQAAGLKGGWMGYFASRGAALGAVPPEVIIATYYNFAPKMVRRAIPDAWSFAPIDDIVEARLRVADTALSRALGVAIDGATVVRCAELARRASSFCRAEGRPLFAAHASLEWPEPPHLALWHATTLLREHRGDGHIAALVTHGVGGLAANVLIAADGLTDPESQQRSRGWTSEEWTEAEAALQARDLLDASGALTGAGRELRDSIEELTDQLALEPYERLGDSDTNELLEGATTLASLIHQAGGVAYPNPMGLPAPR